MATYLGSSLFGDPVYKDRNLSSIATLASVIVHKACHARLHAVRVRSTYRRRHRIGRFCHEQEKRFLRKAMLLNEDLVPESYAVEYSTRYGMSHRWYYDHSDRFHKWVLIKNWVNELRGRPDLVSHTSQITCGRSPSVMPST